MLTLKSSLETADVSANLYSSITALLLFHQESKKKKNFIKILIHIMVE